MRKLSASVLLASFASVFVTVANSADLESKQTRDELGSPENPIVISLLPEHISVGTDANDLPLPAFLKTSAQTLSFKLVRSENYSKAVDDFCNSRVHLAALSMVTYAALKKRCDIEELLAIEIPQGQSAYHSGIFTHRRNFLKKNRHRSFHRLARKTIAFGSPYSVTSFHYPLKMLADLELPLPEALDDVFITGSQSLAIAKLLRGEVELAAASFQSWKAAIDKGMVDPMQYMPLLKSGPIPLPPLIMNRFLQEDTKALIAKLFKDAHTLEDSGPMIGLRGRTINRYDVQTVKQERYINALRDVGVVELSLIERVKNKAYANEEE